MPPKKKSAQRTKGKAAISIVGDGENDLSKGSTVPPVVTGTAAASKQIEPDEQQETRVHQQSEQQQQQIIPLAAGMSKEERPVLTMHQQQDTGNQQRIIFVGDSDPESELDDLAVQERNEKIQKQGKEDECNTTSGHVGISIQNHARLSRRRPIVALDDQPGALYTNISKGQRVSLKRRYKKQQQRQSAADQQPKNNINQRGKRARHSLYEADNVNEEDLSSDDGQEHPVERTLRFGAQVEQEDRGDEEKEGVLFLPLSQLNEPSLGVSTNQKDFTNVQGTTAVAATSTISSSSDEVASKFYQVEGSRVEAPLLSHSDVSLSQMIEEDIVDAKIQAVEAAVMQGECQWGRSSGHLLDWEGHQSSSSSCSFPFPALGSGSAATVAKPKKITAATSKKAAPIAYQTPLMQRFPDMDDDDDRGGASFPATTHPSSDNSFRPRGSGGLASMMSGRLSGSGNGVSGLVAGCCTSDGVVDRDDGEGGRSSLFLTEEEELDFSVTSVAPRTVRPLSPFHMTTRARNSAKLVEQEEKRTSAKPVSGSAADASSATSSSSNSQNLSGAALPSSTRHPPTEAPTRKSTNWDKVIKDCSAPVPKFLTREDTFSDNWNVSSSNRTSHGASPLSDPTSALLMLTNTSAFAREFSQGQEAAAPSSLAEEELSISKETTIAKTVNDDAVTANSNDDLIAAISGAIGLPSS